MPDSDIRVVIGVVYYLVQGTSASNLEWRPYKIASQLAKVVAADLPSKVKLVDLIAGEGFRGVSLQEDTTKKPLSMKLGTDHLIIPLATKAGLDVDGAKVAYGGAPYYDVDASSFGINPTTISLVLTSQKLRAQKLSASDDKDIVRVYGDLGDGAWLFLGGDKVRDFMAPPPPPPHPASHTWYYCVDVTNCRQVPNAPFRSEELTC